MEHKETLKIGTWPTPERTIRVALPAKVAFDLKSFLKVQSSILERFGCSECHSGLDIRYDVVRSFAVDDKLKLHEMVGGVIVTEG
jgi:hypothetical protein